MTLPLLTVTFNGYTMGGPDSPIGVRNVSGWLGLPGGVMRGEERASDHGDESSPVRQGPRRVVVEALNRDYPNRDAVFEDLRTVFAAESVTDRTTRPLTVTYKGVSRYVNAKLLDFKPVEDVKLLAAGFQPFRVEFICPDPRIFGPRITMTAPLVTPAEGVMIEDDLGIPFDLPAEPIGGSVVLSNPGTARDGSDVTVTLEGPQNGQPGVINESTGGELFFDFELVDGDVLTISSEHGGALNGVYRQSAWPSREARRLRAKPGQNIFTAIGQAGGAGAPTIRVDLDPAYL